jgi:hypothetical protein
MVTPDPNEVVMPAREFRPDVNDRLDPLTLRELMTEAVTD